MRFLSVTLWSVNIFRGQCSSSSVRLNRATFIYNSQGLSNINRKPPESGICSINEVFNDSQLKNTLHLPSSKNYLENFFPFYSKCCSTNKQPLGILSFQKLNFSWDIHSLFQNSFSIWDGNPTEKINFSHGKNLALWFFGSCQNLLCSPWSLCSEDDSQC